jgi:hypothetical protein
MTLCGGLVVAPKRLMRGSGLLQDANQHTYIEASVLTSSVVPASCFDHRGCPEIPRPIRILPLPFNYQMPFGFYNS